MALLEDLRVALCSVLHSEDNSVGTYQKVHGTTHSWSSLTRDDPVSEVSLLVNFQSAEESHVDVASANHSETCCRVEGSCTGLLVPNIPDSDKKSLTEISAEVKELAKQAREGSLPMDRLKGGTFTITNLGMYGVESFTPIINQPEVAILGVTTMEDRAVVRGGEIVIRPMMTLSLTFDHRVVDGSVAAEFLQRVKNLLENPALMLA